MIVRTKCNNSGTQFLMVAFKRGSTASYTKTNTFLAVRWAVHFFDRRLVAHVDTGNKANTAIPREAFQVLYPDGRGVVQKNAVRIQGFTGASEWFQLVEIKYELDGVVGSNKKPLRVSADATVTNRQQECHILISMKDMQIFHDQYSYTIQPVEKFGLFAVPP